MGGVGYNTNFMGELLVSGRVTSGSGMVPFLPQRPSELWGADFAQKDLTLQPFPPP